MKAMPTTSTAASPSPAVSPSSAKSTEFSTLSYDALRSRRSPAAARFVPDVWEPCVTARRMAT
jgi:hypothetical protein